jgi:hypothetical protein
MRYKNLDRFSKILIGRGNQINLHYNDDNLIYHDNKYPHYIKGFYIRCRSYSRRVYFDFGHEFARGIKYIGIRLIRY